MFKTHLSYFKVFDYIDVLNISKDNLFEFAELKCSDNISTNMLFNFNDMCKLVMFDKLVKSGTQASIAAGAIHWHIKGTINYKYRKSVYCTFKGYRLHIAVRDAFDLINDTILYKEY